MSKSIWGVIILVIILLVGTITFDIIKNRMLAAYMKNFKMPAQTVSTIVAKQQTWVPHLDAVGTLTAINGVDVSSEVNGMVVAIHFKSGDNVTKGQSLVQLDDSFDQSKLRNDLAVLHLATLQFNRQLKLIKTGATAQQEMDEARAKLEQMQANVIGDRVTIRKKNISAPFSGKVGIRLVNLGEYIAAGKPIVPLQSLDPLFVDFNLPEQDLKDVYVNQPVDIKISAYPKQTFIAKVSAINSKVNSDTRNFQVRAQVPNKDMKLYPGVFAEVAVVLPEDKNVVTIPQTAVTYTLYGDSVYVISKEKDKHGKTILHAQRQGIKLGQQHGDVVEILSGLKAGQEIISAGQVKVQNNSVVTINNNMAIKQDNSI